MQCMQQVVQDKHGFGLPCRGEAQQRSIRTVTMLHVMSERIQNTKNIWRIITGGVYSIFVLRVEKISKIKQKYRSIRGSASCLGPRPGLDGEKQRSMLPLEERPLL